jgi:MFS family permease
MNLPLVCIAKAMRTVGFGAVSVVLALYLIEKGFSGAQVGALFSLTLLEDALLTTLASVFANRLGMRVVLLLSAALILVGGFALAFAQAPWLIALAVVFGIVSPAGYEGGPFAPIEQAIISQSVKKEKLTSAYSWYNLVGFGGAALGALLAGGMVALMKGQPAVEAYQAIFILNAVSSFILAILYLSLDIAEPSRAASSARSVSNEIETAPRPASAFAAIQAFFQNAKQSWRDVLVGRTQTQKYVRQLAGLQAIDAFGGGFIVQSLLTCWFYQRYHVDATFIGPVYFGCNVIAALSFVVAPYVVKRIGLLNAMVFTHLPCSLALCVMPFLPTAGLAAGLLLLRSAFSSMDIPARQAYTMLIVPEEERPAAAGVTTSARAVAQGIAPALTGVLMGNAVTGIPLVLAGAFKSVYDVSLYFAFKSVPFHNEPLDRAPLLDKPTDELELREPERVR